MTEEEYTQIMDELKALDYGSISTTNIESNPIAQNTTGSYYHTLAPTHNHQIQPTWTYGQPPQQPQGYMPPIEGLDELCEMLGVSEGGTDFLLTGVSGVRYSLVNILRAQMELMVRLNILLVHRKLIPDE